MTRAASLLLCVLLAACHGGGQSATLSPLAPVVPASTDPPPTGRPTCAGQGYPGTYPDCQCPQPWQTYTGATASTSGTCTGTPPLSCPAGQSLTGYGAQCCPTGDTGDGTTCFAPPPASCPSTTYGTPPNCLRIPSCSAVIGGYWGGPAAGCGAPAADTGTYPVCVAPIPPPPPPPVCVNGVWEDGSACQCPAGTLGTYPTCIDPASITLTLSLNVDPTTVTDDSAGVTPSTEATVTWSIGSSVPGDSFVCIWTGSNPTSFIYSPTSVGPFPTAQDGSVVIGVTCSDAYGSAVSQTVSLAVVPPPAAPADQFTSFENANASFTLTWFSYLPAAECNVYDANAGAFLTGGGTASGSETTNPLYQPNVYTLYCNGVPDPTVQPIEVTP